MARARRQDAHFGQSAAQADVVDEVERELSQTAGAMELYRRWEEQQWNAYAVDFSEDARQWQAASLDQKRDWLRRRLGGFYIGESEIGMSLAAYVAALTVPEHQFYIATQIADEARHAVFFRRFYEEVLGLGSTPPTPTVDDLTPGTRYLMLTEMPPKVTRLRTHPEDRRNLIEAITLTHLLVEGTIVLSAMQVILKQFKRRGLFPGFCGGFTNVVRDESRHILFGVCVLQEAVRDDPAYGTIILDYVNRLQPYILQSVTPAPENLPSLTADGVNPYERRDFALRSLSRRLASVGLEAPRFTVN